MYFVRIISLLLYLGFGLILKALAKKFEVKGGNLFLFISLVHPGIALLAFIIAFTKNFNEKREESFVNENNKVKPDKEIFHNYNIENVDYEKLEDEEEKEMTDILKDINNIEENSKNKEIADFYKNILEKKLGKDEFIDSYINKSDIEVVNKGRFEIGKEREILFNILLSREDYLNGIERKFKDYDEEALRREFEIFNDFEAETEFRRRKKLR